MAGAAANFMEARASFSLPSSRGLGRLPHCSMLGLPTSVRPFPHCVPPSPIPHARDTNDKEAMPRHGRGGGGIGGLLGDGGPQAPHTPPPPLGGGGGEGR